MPIDKSKIPFDETAGPRTKSRDFLRPTASQEKDTSSVPSSARDKGKGPASQEENERAVGENGRPVPRTVELTSVSTREHPILPGGMLSFWGLGDRASMSRVTRAEDLAQMSASEQVDW